MSKELTPADKKKIKAKVREAAKRSKIKGIATKLKKDAKEL